MTAKARHEGLFITFEGGEGAGKTSQITLLKEKLIKAGYEVIVTREPGGSPGAEAVRHVLLSGAAEPFGEEMEAILFSAARSDHVATVINPALQQGHIVISDRFFDSTRVYQGISGKASPEFLQNLEKIACAGTAPHITIILDLDPKEGMKRAAERRGQMELADRFEKESLKLQKQRRQGFLDIAKQEPERCKVIDASGNLDQVFERVWQEVEKKLQRKQGPATKKQPAPNPGRKAKKAP